MSTSGGSTTARLGRPRDPKVDASILAAARALLAEGGLSGLTVEGTAQRAGVAKTTVYRRYPTRLDLAISAIADLVKGSPSTGALDTDVKEGVDTFNHVFRSPGEQAAFLAVAGAAIMDPQLHARFSRDVLAESRKQIEQTIIEARDRGDATDNTDVDFCYDVLLGAMINRTIIQQRPLDEQWVAKLTELTALVYNL